MMLGRSFVGRAAPTADLQVLAVNDQADVLALDSGQVHLHHRALFGLKGIDRGAERSDPSRESHRRAERTFEDVIELLLEGGQLTCHFPNQDVQRTAYFSSVNSASTTSPSPFPLCAGDPSEAPPAADSCVSFW